MSFLGRLDHQLNLGGVRAEPEDIERVLLAEPTVGAAVVTAADPRPLDVLIEQTEPAALARAMSSAADADDPAAELRRRLRDDDGSRLRLIAYLEPTPAGPVDLAAVQRLAAEHLPALLRPARYGLHDQLPRTPNGKIDRAAAAELNPPGNPQTPTTNPGSSATGGDATSSRGSLDAVEPLVTLFAETLGLETVGAEQSFFELGGHSLLAMELLLRLESRLGTEVTVSSFYDHPTPASLATLLDELGGRRRQQNRFLIPIQPTGTRSPIFAIHVLGVNSEYYRPLAARLGPDQPLYGLGQPTLDLDTDMPTDVSQVAALYREELTRTAPTGPLTLAAVSLGAVVAYELAQQLQAEGREIAMLALFDAAGPAAKESAPTVNDRLAVHRRELSADPAAYVRDRSTRLRERTGRWGEIAVGKGRAKLGLPLSDGLRIRRFIEDNWQSQTSYQFAPYKGSVTVFKAIDDAFTASMAEGGMGWQHIVEGPLEVVPVGGQHLSMLAEPHVEALAERFTEHQNRGLARLKALPSGARTTTTGGGTIDRSSTVDHGTVEAELTSALQEGRFGVTVARMMADDRELDSEALALLQQADQLTRQLATEADELAEVAMAALAAKGVDAVLEPVPERLQHLTFGIRLVQSGAAPKERIRQQATTAVETLASLGYQTQDRMSDGAWQSYVRSHAECMMIRTDSSTTRLNLSWGSKGSMKPWQPRRADLARLDLPAPAWPLYHLLRPLRVADDRAKGRRAGGDLGVFLGTPTPMIADILSLAEPTENDLVVDIGCGDGRVLIEAVKRFGCRARGIENNPELVALARAAVAATDLDDRIEIIEADAGTTAGSAALADATIVFLFLPAESTSALLPIVLGQLGPKGRVIAHEQVESNWPIAPDRSRLVIASGLTVAHLWNA